MRFISRFIITWALAATFALTGCDQQTQQDVREQADRAEDKAADALRAGTEKVEQTWESLKTQRHSETADMERELAVLKQDAAKFKDEQLDRNIAELDGKLSEIGKRLSELLPEEPVETMKDELGRLVNDAKDLYERAKARLAELREGDSSASSSGDGG